MTALHYELGFWGACLDTLEEETKQQVYAPLMGVERDLKGRSVLDIGGGPVSLLLKTVNRGDCAVVDPLLGEFPAWVRQRYQENQIEPWRMRGEDLQPGVFDEAWIYNVLQHVDDPELVCRNARRAATIVRVFEWINLPPYDGHPHQLSRPLLEEWLGGSGMTAVLAENGCFGQAFYGVFP